jgi:hypothetical protein
MSRAKPATTDASPDVFTSRPSLLGSSQEPVHPSNSQFYDAPQLDRKGTGTQPAEPPKRVRNEGIASPRHRNQDKPPTPRQIPLDVKHEDDVTEKRERKEKKGNTRDADDAGEEEEADVKGETKGEGNMKTGKEKDGAGEAESEEHKGGKKDKESEGNIDENKEESKRKNRGTNDRKGKKSEKTNTVEDNEGEAEGREEKDKKDKKDKKDQKEKDGEGETQGGEGQDEKKDKKHKKHKKHKKSKKGKESKGKEGEHDDTRDENNKKDKKDKKDQKERKEKESEGEEEETEDKRDEENRKDDKDTKDKALTTEKEEEDTGQAEKEGKQDTERETAGKKGKEDRKGRDKQASQAADDESSDRDKQPRKKKAASFSFATGDPVTIASHTSNPGQTIEVLDVGAPYSPSRSAPLLKATSLLDPVLSPELPDSLDRNASAADDDGHASNWRHTRLTFHAIGFEQEGDKCTDGHIDSLLEMLPSLEQRPVSPESAYLSPAAEDDSPPAESLFDATEPPKQQLARRRIITASDLQVLLEEDDRDADPSSEEAVRRFQRTNKLSKAVPPVEQIRFLSRQRVNAVLHGDYDRAQECDDLAKSIAIAQSTEHKAERRVTKANEIQERLDSVRREYRWQHSGNLRKLKQTERDLLQRVKDLQVVHQQQLQAFEQKWNSDEFLRRYTKPSPQLLQMKAIEKSMVMSKMFDQAKLIRKSAVSTEKAVTSDRQEVARHEMALERQRIFARQEREIDQIKAKCNQLYNIAKKQIGVDERPMVAQIAHYEKMLEALSGVSEFDTVITPATVVTTQRASTQLASSRTIFKFSAYKSAAQNLKLKIQPMGAVRAQPKRSQAIRVETSPSKKPRKQLFA